MNGASKHNPPHLICMDNVVCKSSPADNSIGAHYKISNSALSTNYL